MTYLAQCLRAGPLTGLQTAKASPRENEAGLGLAFSSVSPLFFTLKSPLPLGKKGRCSSTGFFLGPALLSAAEGPQAAKAE